MNSGSGLTPEEGIFKAPREGNYYFQFHGLVKYKQSNNMIISSCSARKLTQNIKALQPSPRSVQATRLESSWSSIQLQFFTSMIGCEKTWPTRDAWFLVRGIDQIYSYSIFNCRDYSQGRTVADRFSMFGQSVIVQMNVSTYWNMKRKRKCLAILSISR